MRQSNQQRPNFSKFQQNQNRSIQYLGVNSKILKNPERYQQDNKNFNHRDHNISTYSRASRISKHLNNGQMMSFQKISQLSQRLKNIHHFYKLRIDQQKVKNSQRNQVFMQIIEQLQKSHNCKVQSLKDSIQQADDQKKQVSVDQKMKSIDLSIDDILRQSAYLKSENEKLQHQSNQNQLRIQRKQAELKRISDQFINYSNELENFNKVNLRENKKQKEMLEMIDNVIGARVR